MRTCHAGAVCKIVEVYELRLLPALIQEGLNHPVYVSTFYRAAAEAQNHRFSPTSRGRIKFFIFGALLTIRRSNDTNPTL